MDSEAWDERYRESELVWTRDANRFLVAAADGIQPGRALDLAAGEGRNAVWLAERGWEVTAVDFSKVGIEKAHGLAADRGVEVDWICADVLTHDPGRAGFDLVTVLYLHLPSRQLREVLHTAARALAADGILLLVGHDHRNLLEGHGGPQDPELLWHPDRIASWLSEDGLDVAEAGTVERPVEAEDGRVALDSLILARRG